MLSAVLCGAVIIIAEVALIYLCVFALPVQRYVSWLWVSHSDRASALYDTLKQREREGKLECTEVPCASLEQALENGACLEDAPYVSGCDFLVLFAFRLLDSKVPTLFSPGETDTNFNFEDFLKNNERGLGGFMRLLNCFQDGYGRSGATLGNGCGGYEIKGDKAVVLVAQVRLCDAVRFLTFALSALVCQNAIAALRQMGSSSWSNAGKFGALFLSAQCFCFESVFVHASADLVKEGRAYVSDITKLEQVVEHLPVPDLFRLVAHCAT